MAEMVQKLLLETPPKGWRWQLTGGGKTIRSGSADTKEQANAEADQALDELRKIADANKAAQKANETKETKGD